MAGVLLLLGDRSGQAAHLPAIGHVHAAVATDHPLASDSGVRVLRQGGNAVDAACASAFALGVVNPAGSGLGGGGFLIYLPAGQSKPVVLDFREMAPMAAHPSLYEGKGRSAQVSQRGGLAVAVPGEAAGCAEAVRRFGRLSLARVVAPAVLLAREGFPVGPHLSHTVAAMKNTVAAWPDLARLLMPGGRPLAEGQRLVQPSLAAALSDLGRAGPQVFYRGWIGQEIVKAVQAHGGVITERDLRAYTVKEREPLDGSYRGYQVFSAPPPSSGGVALIQALNILGRYPLSAMGHNSSLYVHHVAEALKHAFADRARFLGDPDFGPVPVARLLSMSYADLLAGRIRTTTRTTRSYGSPLAPKAPSPDRGGTSHISVVDAWGNAAALTTTINTSFGSLIVAGKSGIILNNQMDDFTINKDKANYFGLKQSDRNRIEPGKRPLSCMAPAIVTLKGKPVLVVGASGGPTIISATLQAILNILDFGLEPQSAVSSSRIHHQWLPNRLVVETDLPQDVIYALARRRHMLDSVSRPTTAVQVVMVGRDGRRFGASDPRKWGAAAGY